MTELAAWSDRGLLATLKRRRRLRAGLVNVAYAAIGISLGLALPKIGSGPTLPTASTLAMLVALGGGLISFIALVFSLLFLVVQYGSTTFTPRLTLFRDDPLVWHAFGAFIGVFLYATTAALQLGSDRRTSVVVPAAAMLLIVVSLMLARALQLRALRLVHLNTTLNEIRTRGEEVLTKLYSPQARRSAPEQALPELSQTVAWNSAFGVLRQLDLPRLHAAACAAGAAFRVHVGVGEEVRRYATLLTVHGASRPLDEDGLRAVFEVGTDRSFTQDPLLAFRLLTDIGLRALSPAVNDPATAASAVALVHDLLSIMVDRELDIGRVHDTGGELRVVLRMPTWEQFLRAGVDDLIHYGRDAPQVNRRLRLMLEDLLTIAPDDRAGALQARLTELGEQPAANADTESPSPQEQTP